MRAGIQVWDPFVRIAHWTVALGFVAYLTEDVMTVHVWAGYVVGALVLARIVWGFIGSRHARFSDFATGPMTAARYLWDLMCARTRRYIGHSPAGGVMVIALLVFLAATVVTGLVRYAEEERAGPLAPLYAQTSSMAGIQAVDGKEDRGERHGRESALGEAHEVIANITLGLVVFHIVGVLLASFVHHENLAKAMITGRKRPD
ncbi:cytochrome b/b6 domain-containing protein [Pseudaminobacter sp. NGMCC 1.201702]|uniref:cytochrome b/b6 domain-containing protein n=1 Tax=Pseudaminobacter sp. NGMCC 1.201702 TaxID=3391825 RepID=UPI0039EE031A